MLMEMKPRHGLFPAEKDDPGNYKLVYYACILFLGIWKLTDL